MNVYVRERGRQTVERMYKIITCGATHSWVMGRNVTAYIAIIIMECILAEICALLIAPS